MLHKHPSNQIGREWAESSQRGRTPIEFGTLLSFEMEVLTPKQEASGLAPKVSHTLAPKQLTISVNSVSELLSFISQNYKL
ncbi:hypothetical protein SAMN05421858_3520 [Haladaptatus litoreus]|uniref:Uncharacterized protein n=1 Tax=Haladaptatus litoreus TaxID=553468 RepID=A0A1N7DCW5_9EURY|nr:hypothetical protein SAMN05421858_3520 [Haladaptatus litoreus]